MITYYWLRIGPAIVMATCTFCCPGKHNGAVVISLALGDQAPTSMGVLL